MPRFRNNAQSPSVSQSNLTPGDYQLPLPVRNCMGV